MEGMRLLDQFAGGRVAFQTKLDIEYCSDFHFLPALATNMDHPAIDTHPFSNIKVIAR